jgi:glycosyltransferase involved in cell wall biosynthesis
VAEAHGLPLAGIVVAHDACREPRNSVPQSGRRDRLRVVYVGSFYEGRGIDTLFELAHAHPSLDFVCAGGTADEINQGVPPNMRMLGRVPHAEVPALLADADILLMPYGKRVTIDGVGDTSQFCSPLKLFEYLAAGKPIASTRTESIGEVLEHRSNALLIEAGDTDGWISALGELAIDGELRERLSRAALATARIHTWDRRVSRVLRPR